MYCLGSSLVPPFVVAPVELRLTLLDVVLTSSLCSGYSLLESGIATSSSTSV